MAQDFFAAFGHDGVGQVGSETTINSGDMAGILMIAVQALEKRTVELKQKQAQIAVLESRLEALELRNNHSIQITAGERHLICYYRGVAKIGGTAESATPVECATGDGGAE
jgi:hypothetical protein